MFVESAGLLTPASPPLAEAIPPPAEDPCGLRQPLAGGIDARCTFELRRESAGPLTVDLDQRWSGNVLSQWLNVREAGVSDPVHFAFAASGGPQAARILRLRSVRTADGDEHLTYLIGRCGGPVCPSADLLVVGGRERQMRTFLNVRLGRLADIEIRGSEVIALDGLFREGAQRPESLAAQRFVWDGSSYSIRELAFRPLPSPTPSAR